MNAVRYGTSTHITFILDANKSLIEQYDEHGSTCVHWAAKRGDYDILDLLKTYHGGCMLDVPANCENLMRPAHWAASDGKIGALRFFIDNRLDINCQDANGCTPLAVAVQYMQTDAVIYLIKNGADLTVKDGNGDSALHWAAYKGSEELIGLLMYFMPREMDVEDKFGQAPIHLAALGGHHGVVEFLLKENGAACNNKDKNGLTPLDLAMKKSNVQCEWVLRQNKATSGWDLLKKMGTDRLKVRG
jgi:ankyrin repeat protein